MNRPSLNSRMPVYNIFLVFILIVSASAFDLGDKHKYSYETSVIMNQECGAESMPQIVGHKLKAQVHLTAVWQNPQNSLEKLIKIEVLEPKLSVPKKSEFLEHVSKLDKISSTSSYILWESGEVKKIWDDPSENYSLRNLKRAIASLIQLQNHDQEKKQTDVAGNCDVIYKARGNTIRKRKGNCVHSLLDKTLSQPYGIRSPSTHHMSTTDCDLKDLKSYTVTKCKAVEYVKMFSNVWQKSSLCVNTKSEFLLEGVEKDKEIYTNGDVESVVKGLKKQNSESLQEGNLVAVYVEKGEQSSSYNLIDAVKKYQDGLKATNLGKLKSASAFYKLLKVFRSATEEEILNVLKNKKFKPIISQILDLVAASSTESSLNAGFKFFTTFQNYDEILERFLVSLSVLPRPDAFVVKAILAVLDKPKLNEKIQATLSSTLGAVLKTYADLYEIADPKVVEDARVYLENKLKACNSDSCAITFLRGLRNAGLPRSKTFLEYVSKGGKPALEAMLALRSIPVRLLPPESQEILLKVFNKIGRKQDRSTRAVAAEILLNQHPDEKVLRNILTSLLDQSQPEFSTFLASKILLLVSSDEELRSSILKLLPEKGISYYYALSQKGRSSVLTNPFFVTESMNATYGVEMELAEGGALKRGSFDVNLKTLAGVSHLLSVGTFAEGLSSIAGSESTDGGSSDGDDASPTAGMEITLMGSSLRPYVFFSSMSELMGHVWSGTASELTPAFQCTSAFSDDENVVVLNNGMAVRLQLRAVLSADLSAATQISIWSRNAQSQIKKGVAALIRGAAKVDTDFVVTEGSFQISSESSLDFNTNTDFYESPLKMCIQMNHPNILISDNFVKSTSVTGTDYLLKRNKKRKNVIQSRSFALHPRNDEMCRIMNSAL